MKRILWLPTLLSLFVAGPAAAADNVTVKDAAGATVTTASKDVTGVQFRKDICVTLADTTIDCFLELNAALRDEDTASASADKGLPIFAVRAASPANTSGTDGDYEPLQISGGKLYVHDSLAGTGADAVIDTGACATWEGCFRSMRDSLYTLKTDTSVPTVAGFAGTATATITRPADAALYAANDAFSDSTTAPTSCGFTLASMCRASGGSGVLTDATFIYSTAQVVAGTIFIYDSAPTAQNDNAAWSVTDADQLKLVGTIPFVTVADALNSYHNVQNLNMGYTCSGTVNLRYMVKITTSYTPASGDTLTIRAKYIQSN